MYQEIHKLDDPETGKTWFAVYEYFTYASHSVLAGQTGSRFLDGFDTLQEAITAYPKADRNDHRGWEPSQMSDFPPSDFDPADAGETW
ncbi:MAG: hypothetical protein KDC71_22730 [Acidobacteria bacterium]|nr:hypothetical protein [Acidobacteriota bacterium]